MEGAHQRSVHGRFLSHRERDRPGARAAAAISRRWDCRRPPKRSIRSCRSTLSELISWTAIGARTTESQTHREMASGLSTPVGFKNGTDGTLRVAINALQSVRHPHHFLGITQQGQSAVFRTRGNAYGHIVLRGGGGRTNYDAASVAQCERELGKAGCATSIMVDCSHGNSNKDAERQPLVAENCVSQVLGGQPVARGPHAGESPARRQSADARRPQPAALRRVRSPTPASTGSARRTCCRH